MVLVKSLKLKVTIVSILSLLSCVAQAPKSITMDEEKIIGLTIDLSDSIKISNKEIPIFFELMNFSTHNYKVGSAQYWVNIFIELRKGNQVIHGIRVKPDLSKRNEYVDLGKGKTVRAEFDFSLNQIYRELSKGLYVIEATYIGTILNEEGTSVKPLQDILSRREFIIE